MDFIVLDSEICYLPRKACRPNDLLFALKSRTVLHFDNRNVIFNTYQMQVVTQTYPCMQREPKMEERIGN